MLRIEDCSKSFGNQVIFDHISLQIDTPGMYVICGKSGCGKSTLLNMIAGFEPVTSGSITTDAEVMTIFQNYELIDELSVYDNIFLERKEEEKDKEFICKLGLEKLLQQYPNELSGGQKQRVGIVRALISNPKIICCDEPTESLDVTNKEIVLDILKEYSKTHIVIMVTHQLDTIDTYGDTILRVENKKLVIEKNQQKLNSIDTDEMRLVKPHSIKKLVGKIIQKKNRIFLTIFVLLILCAEVLSMMKQVMFYIPDTTDTVNANMLYIETDQQDDLPFGNIEKIVKFKDIADINGTQYQMNIYPYVAANEELSYEGNLPKEMNVIVNQNVANKLFQDNWKGKQLDLTLMVDPYATGVVFTVTGVIEEKDTSALNVYYDLNGLMEYSKTITLSDGRPFNQLIEQYGTYSQKEVTYDQIESFIEQYQNKSTKVYAPLYSERKDLEDQSRIYRYLFTAFTWIVAILLTISICLFTTKETQSYKKSFAILISQKIDINLLKKEYVLKKTIPVIVFVVVDFTALVLIHLKVNYLNIIPFIVLVGSELILYLVMLKISLQDMKQETISKLLKEMNG